MASSRLLSGSDSERVHVSWYEIFPVGTDPPLSNSIRHPVRAGIMKQSCIGDCEMVVPIWHNTSCTRPKAAEHSCKSPSLGYHIVTLTKPSACGDCRPASWLLHSLTQSRTHSRTSTFSLSHKQREERERERADTLHPT